MSDTDVELPPDLQRLLNESTERGQSIGRMIVLADVISQAMAVISQLTGLCMCEARVVLMLLAARAAHTTETDHAQQKLDLEHAIAAAEADDSRTALLEFAQALWGNGNAHEHK